MSKEKIINPDKKRIRYGSTWFATGAVVFSLLAAVQAILQRYIPVESEALQEVIGYIPGLVILYLLLFFVLKGAKRRWPDAVPKAWAMPAKKVSPLVFICGIFIILGFGLAGNMLGSLLDPLLPATDTSAQQAMFTKENLVWIFISYAIFPPLLEEMMCRGFTSRMMKGSGTLCACLIAGIPFALMHTDVESFLGNVIFGMLAGYFAYTYENVWMGVIAHILNNGMIVIIMIFFPEYGDIIFYVVVGVCIALAIAGALYLILTKKVVFEKNQTTCAHPIVTVFTDPVMIILIVLTVGMTVLSLISSGTA